MQWIQYHSVQSRKQTKHTSLFEKIPYQWWNSTLSTSPNIGWENFLTSKIFHIVQDSILLELKLPWRLMFIFYWNFWIYCNGTLHYSVLSQSQFPSKIKYFKGKVCNLLMIFWVRKGVVSSFRQQHLQCACTSLKNQYIQDLTK